MRLAGRIARLERSPAVQRPPEPCAECGRYPEGHGPKPTYRLRIGTEGDTGPDFCRTCGRKRVFRIEFDQAG